MMVPALALMLLAGRALGSDAPEATVTGVVTLRETPSGRVRRDAARVVVWLVPRPGSASAPVSAAPRDYRMIQEDKSFVPSLLVIPVGSVVSFPNRDPWFHNVFSLYRGQRFDLGLYEAGATRRVRFNRPGVSYLFCNIHPQMAAVIVTVATEFFGISDRHGRILIAGVPAGDYVLHVWSEGADAQSLRALQRPLRVKGDAMQLPALTLVLPRQAAAEHKNLFGRDYGTAAQVRTY